jgi:hypothetical protein
VVDQHERYEDRGENNPTGCHLLDPSRRHGDSRSQYSRAAEGNRRRLLEEARADARTDGRDQRPSCPRFDFSLDNGEIHDRSGRRRPGRKRSRHRFQILRERLTGTTPLPVTFCTSGRKLIERRGGNPFLAFCAIHTVSSALRIGMQQL